MKNEKQVTLSIEQAKLMFDTDSQELKDIALKTFPELNKSKYPMSHDELQDLLEGKEIPFINNFSRVDTTVVTQKCGFFYYYNSNIILSKQRAKEYLAFAQLIALRDKWNEIDEFEPDWSDSNIKYCIILSTNEIIVSTDIYRSRALSFGKRETAYFFANTFRNLIEQSKNLI